MGNHPQVIMPEDIVLSRRQARAPSPTMRDVLAVLFRQRRLTAASFVAIFLGVLLYGVLTPTYQAQMKVLVRRGRSDPVITPQASAPPDFNRREVSEEELNSEAELLRDEELLRKVARETGMASGRGWGWWRTDRPEDEVRIARAARRLGQGLKVEPVRRTTLIAVRYESSDPELAARVLRSLAAAYVEKHLQVHRPSGEFQFLEQQAAEYGKRLGEAELQLMEFIGYRDVVAAALQRDLTLQRLSEAEASDRQIREALAETGQRIRSLQEKLASFPERSTSQVRIADNPQLLEKLKSTLLTLELKRTELLTRYEPSYRLVQEVEKQIAETKAAIAAEERAPVREETTEKDPNYEWAKAEMAKAQVEFSALEARAAASGGELARYHRQARRLGEDAITQQDLLRSAKAAEENYLLYVKKREEARISDALDERGILNVTIAEQPAVPALPVRAAWTFGLLGFVLAGSVSAGLAFASDFLDPAFRTPDEVVACLDAPVLASLPKSRA